LKTYDLLVVGELNVDLILSDEDPVPHFGQHETLVADAALDLGSASAILACQAARLGLRTAFAGKVGRDLFGRLALDTLAQCGVDVRGVVVDPAVKTGLTVHLSSPHDRAMMTYLGAMAAFAADEVSPELLDSSCHLHVSSLFLQTELRRGLAGLLRAARDRGLTVSVDPGWDPADQWNGVLHEIEPLLNLFFPNEQEIYRITGQTDLLEAMAAIGQIVPIVAVKLGAHGAAALARGTVYRQPAYPVQAVDTTGAGDSFNAGFLYGFLTGQPVPECLRLACVCGALSTLALGGIAAQPTLAQVRQALDRPRHAQGL
jgi:sugar/nucleoside kinase (ribokinase family)